MRKFIFHLRKQFWRRIVCTLQNKLPFINHRPSNKRMGVSEWKSVLLWHYLLLNFIEKWSLGWLMTYSDLQNNICKALTHSPEHLNGVWDTFHYDVWPFLLLGHLIKSTSGQYSTCQTWQQFGLGPIKIFLCPGGP